MLKPAADRILVREAKVEQTKGGIFVPQTGDDKAKNLAQRCEILAIGPGAVHAEDGRPVRTITCQQICGLPIEVGSIVYCHRFIGDYRLPDSSYAKLVGAAEILGVES